MTVASHSLAMLLALVSSFSKPCEPLAAAPSDPLVLYRARDRVIRISDRIT